MVTQYQIQYSGQYTITTVGLSRGFISIIIVIIEYFDNIDASQ